MNQKQIIILVVLVAVLGAAGVVVYNKQNADRRSGQPELGKKLLGDLAVNDIAHVRLSQGSNEVNLVKQDDRWRVRERNNYPANYNEISDFLLKVKDLKALRTEEVGPSQLARISLVPGQGTNAALVAEFKGKEGKEMASLLLGKVTLQKSTRPSPMGGMDDQGWPNGRFVKVGSSKTVSVISDPMNSVEPQPERWLNKDFFKIEKPRAISVQFTETTNSWKLSRETETAEWKLVDPKPGEQLDSGKVSGFSNPFGSPSFNDVSNSSKPEELGLDKPTVVTIDTFDGFSYSLKLGQKTNDNIPLTLSIAANLAKERTPGKDEKPEDKEKLDKEYKEKQKKLEEKLASEKSFEKWVYLIPGWSAESVLKNRFELMAEKKEDPAASTNAPAATGNGAGDLLSLPIAGGGDTNTPPAAPIPPAKP